MSVTSPGLIINELSAFNSSAMAGQFLFATDNICADQSELVDELIALIFALEQEGYTVPVDVLDLVNSNGLEVLSQEANIQKMHRFLGGVSAVYFSNAVRALSNGIYSNVSKFADTSTAVSYAQEVLFGDGTRSIQRKAGEVLFIVKTPLQIEIESKLIDIRLNGKRFADSVRMQWIDFALYANDILNDYIISKDFPVDYKTACLKVMNSTLDVIKVQRLMPSHAKQLFMLFMEYVDRQILFDQYSMFRKAIVQARKFGDKEIYMKEAKKVSNTTKMLTTKKIMSKSDSDKYLSEIESINEEAKNGDYADALRRVFLIRLKITNVF